MAPLKLHLKTGGGAASSNPSAATSAQTPGGSSSGFKLKLSASQPPTPAVTDVPPFPSTSGGTASATGKKPKVKKDGARPVGRPAGKKRAANDDTISPAAKRVASNAGVPERKGSIVLKVPKAAGSIAASSATRKTAIPPRISLKKRPSTGPILRRLNVKGRVPERPPGNAYDSEDSDREPDPAKEQLFVLRMQPGEDSDYLRDAIANRTIGLSPNEGGAEVSLKFLDRDLRRALVTVRGRMYAAVLVDLPCIIETMKSWDRKGWWKVSDIHQMLLVLGRCTSEDEAKTFALPQRVIDSHSMQYAHGLTPPMHWVRRQRFRKRLSHKDTANVEEEVQKLLNEDERAEREGGGEVTFDILNPDSLERSTRYHPDDDDEEDYDEELDADGEPIDTIEDGQSYAGDFQQQMDDEMDVDAVEADLQALFDEENEGSAEPTQQPLADTLITASPTALPDQAASFAAVENSFVSDTPGATSLDDEDGVAGSRAGETEDDSGDDDDDDDDDDSEDEDSIDVADEDAQQRTAERNQQLEEIADLDREIELVRQKLANTKNQLLIAKFRAQERQLLNDRDMKKAAFGFEDEDQD